MNKYPKRKTSVSVRVLDDETVILDREEGFVHQFNQTASYVWHRLDGDLPPTTIADQLVKAFEVDLETAVRDVAKFVSHLDKLHLLEVAEG